jgi:CheY-like chemotaxis protein
LSIKQSQVVTVYGQIHVLVVEEDEVNAQVAHAMLERLGCRIHAAANGGEAIDFFQKETYDLILMGWKMPVMDGVEATAIIRAMPRGRGTPIIGTSAGLGRMECIAAGMNDQMPKPFTVENMKAVLRKWTTWDETLQAGAGLQ